MQRSKAISDGNGVTAQDDEQADAEERLLAAMKKLGVFSRIDEEGRVLAHDGRNEYEVTVDLTHLLSKRIGPHLRVITVGTSSLSRLERGDVTELFPHGVRATAEEAQGSAPTSPHYGPLEWGPDADYLDGDDGIAAEGEDWRYTIHPVRGMDDEVIGYRVSGGDCETGSEFGSALVGGSVGELTVVEAKMAAANDYASRYCEAEGFLDGLLDDWEDDDGPLSRRNPQGRIVCRVDEPGLKEVEVVATLQDYGDEYDAADQRVTVSLRTILGYNHNGDRDALLDEVRGLIRRQPRANA